MVLTCGYPILGFSAEPIGPRNNSTVISNGTEGITKIHTTSDRYQGTSALSPEFIRPTVNPRAGCNIWGPLCQTGSIVVGVNITKRTTTTTVPCSQYLSAQAESAMHGYLDGRGTNEVYFLGLDDDYRSSFGRSPECKSYADYFPEQYDPAAVSTTSKTTVQQASRLRRGPHKIHLSADANPESKRSIGLTFSNCGSSQLKDPEYYVPPGLSRSVYGFGGPVFDYYCCGDCTLQVSEIKLLYFPGPTATNCPTSHALTNSSSIQLTKSKIVEPRVASLAINGSILVSDGYT